MGRTGFAALQSGLEILSRDGFLNTSLLLAVNGSKNSRVLVGCVHSSHHQSFPRGWIRKSFPVDREGLTVLNSILPVNEHRIIFQSGLTYSHKDEMDPIQTIKTHFFKVMSAQYLLIP